jgi:hypothetical protein
VHSLIFCPYFLLNSVKTFSIYKEVLFAKVKFAKDIESNIDTLKKSEANVVKLLNRYCSKISN